MKADIISTNIGIIKNMMVFVLPQNLKDFQDKFEQLKI